MPQEFPVVDVPLERAESLPGAPLEAILSPGILEHRPCRPHDELHVKRAVEQLMNGWSADSATVLQSLTDTILNVLRCDSAGISLINDSHTRFWWPAVAGVLAPHVGGGTPINFGPCGDVMNVARPLLLQQPHLRYTYLRGIPPIREVLLVPFWEGGQFAGLEMTGTIWAVIHAPPHDLGSRHRHAPEFDREDLRILDTLAEVTGAAYKVWQRHQSASSRSASV